MSAPDHLYELPEGTHRTDEEREEGRRSARRSMRRGAVMVVLGVAALFVPVRLVAVIGFVVGFLGLLVLLVAAMQASVLKGPAASDGDEGDAEE